jgi:hypothetical protein
VASAGFNLVGLNCEDTDFRGCWGIEVENHRTYRGTAGVSYCDRFAQTWSALLLLGLRVMT